MAQNTRRKEISDFAKNLTALASSAPDGYARRDINRMVLSLRKRYWLKPEEKQKLILDLLADGLTTFTELLGETAFTKTQLERDLKTLESNKQIRVAKIRRGSGAGRPQLCYFPV